MMDWCLFFQSLSKTAPGIAEAEEAKKDGMRAAAAPQFLGRSPGQPSGRRLPRGLVLTCLYRTRVYIYLKRPAGWETRFSEAAVRPSQDTK